MADDPPTDSPKPSPLGTFWSELKRRKVMRVAITYAVVAWIAIQVSATVFPMFDIPIWAARLVALLLLIGFPVAIILAWAFELSPDGIKTTKAARIDNPDAESDSTVQKKRNWFSVLFAAAIPTLIFGALAIFFYATRSAPPVSPDVSGSGSSLQVEDLDKSIAVLPLTNISPDPENAFFADGCPRRYSYQPGKDQGTGGHIAHVYAWLQGHHQKP